jgi:glucose-1-phosphatase
MPIQDADLVCFDLGCVLIEICSGLREACQRAGVRAGYDGEPVLQQQMTEVFVRHECGLIDNDEYARQIGSLVNISRDQATDVLSAWLKGPFPGVCELIDELRQRQGVQLACLSNTNALHWSIMSAETGPCALPLHRLHHRFASHIIGCMKPDPRIYQHVEDATGVEPHRIVFFDDRPENCQGARARGWTAHEIALDGDPVAQMRRHLADRQLL